MDRILGVVMLKVSTYREIAEDPNATQPAVLVVSLVGLIAGIVSGVMRYNPDNPQQLLPVNPMPVAVYAVLGIVFGLLAWFVGAWILAVVARWFGGKTNINEMLRVTGFVEIFGVIALISLLGLLSPWLSWLASIVIYIASILRLLGYIVGIREAAEFSTGNAIVTAIFAVIVAFIVRGAGEMLAKFLGGVLGV